MPQCLHSCSDWPPKPHSETRPPFAHRRRRLSNFARPRIAEVWISRDLGKTANRRSFLAGRPQNGFWDRRRNVRHYPVSGTPFTVVYEYDDDELRVLFVVHQHADRRRLDSSNVEW
jgi:hypothetical protein